MSKTYVAYCHTCNGSTAWAVADTVQDQVDAAPDVKRWIKRGDRVELVEHENAPPPEMCRCERPRRHSKISPHDPSCMGAFLRAKP